MKYTIEQLIAQNQLETAIENLFSILSFYMKANNESEIKTLYNNLIMISGKLQGVLQDLKHGIIRYDEANIIKAQVRNSLITELNNYPVEIFSISLPPKDNSENKNNLTKREKITISHDLKYEYDIFLCFSSKDITWVQNIAHQLRGYGLRVFFSDENLRRRVGKSFFETIDNALVTSKNFLLICTTNSMQSEYVRAEYETFFQEYTMHDSVNRRFIIYSGSPNFNKDIVPALLRRFQTALSVEQIIDTIAEKKLQKKESVNQESFTIRNAETDLWKMVIEKNTKDAYIYYLKKFPKGKFSNDAKNFIETLNKKSENNIGKILKITALITILIAVIIYFTNKNYFADIINKYEKKDTLISFNYQTISIPSASLKMAGNNIVTVDSFKIGKYEVTQGQWKAIMNNNPSFFKGCDSCPVEQVSWKDIQIFLRELKQKTGKSYRLPTAAEWEYAAGGKNSQKYAGTNNSNSLKDYAWYNSTSQYKANVVGRKKANTFGIFDMCGNVWEWCEDWESEKDSSKVIKGGSWDDEPDKCKISLRNSYNYAEKDSAIGFRLVYKP